MDSKYKKKSFEIKRNMSYLINYGTSIIFFWLFNNDCLALLLLCKIYVFDIFNMVEFFSDFCYIVKYWNSDRLAEQHVKNR